MRTLSVMALNALLVTALALTTNVDTSLAAAKNPGLDHSTLIVKLTPTSGVAKSWIKRTGRADFDRLLDAQGVDALRQVMPPQGVPLRLRKLAEKLGLADYAVIKTPQGADVNLLKAEIENLADVLSVEYGGVAQLFSTQTTPNDPYFSIYQYPLRNTGTQPPADPGTAGADAQMEAAWNFTTGDTSTVLAIIDTGLDRFHPDFLGRLWANPGEIYDGVDNDGNGLIDDVNGWNFGEGNNLINDDFGHGTHVTSIAAATGNDGIGIAGMNWKCRIMVCKIAGDDGSADVDEIAAAIHYAVNEGANVLNMSFGYYTDFSVLRDAVAYATAAGKIVCAAMGNENTNALAYPVSYDSVISVGATDSDDRRAHPFCFAPSSTGSNFAPWIDVCAAGDYVWGDFPVDLGSYTYQCGTSMATPHVAGLATLILALRPNFEADSTRELIRRGAEDQVGLPSEDVPGFDIYHGYGRINGRITLQALALNFAPIITVPGAQSVTELDTLRFAVSAFDSNLTDPSLSQLPLVNTSFIDHGDGTATFTFVPDANDAGVVTASFVASDANGHADTGTVMITVLDLCGCDCHGDPSGCNGVQDVTDVVQLINVAFRGAASILDPNNSCPFETTDLNCTTTTDVLDVVKMVNVAFRGANQATEFCNPCP